MEVVLKLWDSTTEKSLLVEVQEINRTLKTTKDIALEKVVLPIDKHGNIRDMNGERMWHVFGTKRGRILLRKNLYQCDFFTYRNNKIFNQQRFIYIFVISKHFSIQTVSYYESIIFCTLLMPLNDCNSNTK